MLLNLDLIFIALQLSYACGHIWMRGFWLCNHFGVKTAIHAICYTKICQLALQVFQGQAFLIPILFGTALSVMPKKDIELEPWLVLIHQINPLILF